MAGIDSGVTVENMQDYLNVDGDESVIQSLISMAESDVIGNIDDTIPVETYRKYYQFNQAVRVMVDFMYFNRGNLGVTYSSGNNASQVPYPAPYLYLINGIRWKIRRDYNENSGQSLQSKN
ncbi:head-tail connector protein [Lactiplantibacillus plantarum]|uniref:head-tail connector protein n=1 Tax=Lactiplantibacillus plantarum TaxID=1590 RepID=UPI000709B075|nr:head-tail connector protein [Lactiplantibacillus plantarum]KRN36114.1 hypothetical protein IV39_GL000507 [Lactiplantibacillus plantarum]MCS8621559.1 phage gp6-like head-tail connector protein [Lactiplantibacillus plantarum]MCT3251503.1 phage gp6-like head-tail connector protein [Lactiplantibacillus plantarum]